MCPGRRTAENDLQGLCNAGAGYAKQSRLVVIHRHANILGQIRPVEMCIGDIGIESHRSCHLLRVAPQRGQIVARQPELDRVVHRRAMAERL